MTHCERRAMHTALREPSLYGGRKRVAFVTGAARGIGRAIALRLATDGLDVAVNDSDASELEDTRAKVEKLGARCVALVGDVSDEGRVDEMVNEVVQALGYLDVMVANAGIARNKPILESTAADLDKVLRINLRSVHLCYKIAAKQMIRQGQGGKLIAACSVNGFRTAELLSSYCASKFGVRGYNQAAALELAEYGITANCYAPGFIGTRMTLRDPADAGSDKTKLARLQAGKKFIKELSSAIPLTRMGTPEDVANLVSFLASRNSDYITGQALPVSGGLYML